jgi:5-methylcytosine-specific restriction protein A
VAERPLRFCRARGCKARHRDVSGFCENHIYLLQGFVRKRTDNSIYNNKKWKGYSSRFRKAKQVCAHFDRCGGLAEVVDHIVPVNQGGDFWDSRNHQALCHKCHNRKSQGERYGVIKKKGEG